MRGRMLLQLKTKDWKQEYLVSSFGCVTDALCGYGRITSFSCGFPHLENGPMIPSKKVLEKHDSLIFVNIEGSKGLQIYNVTYYYAAVLSQFPFSVRMSSLNLLLLTQENGPTGLCFY